MDMDLPPLPKSDELVQISRLNKKQGRFKTLLDQFQAFLPVLIIFAGLLYANSNENRLKKIEQSISISNKNVINNNINNPDESEKKEIESEKNIKGRALGVNTNFNPDDWIIENFEVDKEGFYCSLTRKFDYWSIWSKETFPPVVNAMKVKILTKSRKGSKNPPSIVLSYGEYRPNFSPTQFYRLNVFDTDMETIRLYDYKNKSVAQDWISEQPELSNEMSVTLSPRSQGPNSRAINLNPSLQFVIPDKLEPVEFTPQSNFEITLPTVGIEDGTVRKQIGIGSSTHACFKPITVEISK